MGPCLAKGGHDLRFEYEIPSGPSFRDHLERRPNEARASAVSSGARSVEAAATPVDRRGAKPVRLSPRPVEGLELR
jgi:hypothetical protein